MLKMLAKSVLALSVAVMLAHAAEAEFKE